MRIHSLSILIFLFASYFAKAQDISSPAIRRRLNAIEAIKNDTLRIDSLNRYANNIENENPRDALAIARRTKDESEKIGYKKGVLGAYENLGACYKDITDYPAALHNNLQALDLEKNLQMYTAQIRTCIAISVVYDMTEDMDKEQKYVEDALAICRANKVTAQLPNVLDELAIIYKKKGQLDTAIQIYNRALEAARANKDTMATIAALTNMAITYKSDKQYEASLRAYTEAIALTDTTNNVYVYAVIMDNMAILFYDMGDMKQAEHYALLALALQPKTSEVTITLDCYDLLRKIYTSQKKYPLALEYYSKWAAVKDTVLNTEKSRQVKEMQAKFDTDAKDKQIKAQKEQISYNRKTTFFLVFSTLLIFAIGLIIYSNQRKTQNLNKLVTKQKQELEKVNAVKDRIFSVISHDMRTPVNSLISFTQILDNGNLSPEKLTAYSASLKNNLGYTAGLLENLLSWAQTQMQGYKPVLENFSVEESANQAIGILEPEANRKNIAIENNVTSGTLVHADRNMTALILRNLLSNAIKFTGNEGRITLSVRNTNEHVEIKVCDNGVGMAQDIVAQFNTRNDVGMDSTRGTANEKGTGLGLMLCKSFALLMNGNITVENAQGKGTCFTVALPAA